MPVTSVTTDPEALTLTLVAEFPVTVERLWAAVADPRQLERFWGPPGYPTTFGDYDLRVGGHARYWMTTPEGERLHARWDFLEIDEPHRIAMTDLFADEHGNAALDMPVMHVTLGFDATDSGSRFTIVVRAESADDLATVVAMGMEDGYAAAIDQLDTVLADLRDLALGKGTATEVLDDTHVKITRAFEAPRAVIWKAYTDSELKKRWLLGPDGWEMTECVDDHTVGGSYRNSWAPLPGTEGEAFGFEGENLVIDEPRRLVSTERMIGMPVQTINDVTFDEEDGVTLMTMYITYPDAATRDMILGTGMTEGMEASFQRLERELLSV